MSASSDPADYLPPHALCDECRHFICKHDGYPGRLQTGPTCAVMEMVPTGVGRDEIKRCNCMRRAVPKRG